LGGKDEVRLIGVDTPKTGGLSLTPLAALPAATAVFAGAGIVRRS
jgi:hypothetical protein